jgi:RimJ/RimL family protein N-acetyltransferase
MSFDDAAFMLRLLNEPSFLQNIGDKGVRTTDDARNYILNGPLKSYAECGFGLWLTELKESATPIGICGLLKRDVLEDVDIGYALVPEYWSKGYALEAVSAVIDYAIRILHLKRLAAIVNADNQGSIRLLEKTGFRFERMIRLPNDADEIQLFVVELPTS